MLLIVGIALVIGSVLGGFMVAGGNPLLLWQPSEFIVILGAAFGALLISSPLSILKRMVGGIITLLKGNPYNKKQYLNLLKTIFEFFNIAALEGFSGIEDHIATPEKSIVFSKNHFFLANHEAVCFLTDTMKFLQMAGGGATHDLDTMLDQDLEILREEVSYPAALLGKIADSLPGLGIVAAVLGIIITMQSIGGEASEVGKHVAAALVGTFLGVLACYGFFQPFASSLELIGQSQVQYIECIKVAVLAYAKGIPASLVAEFARRVVPTDTRPTFEELEEALRSIKNKSNQQ
jgi:chemotaxis protein MotA